MSERLIHLWIDLLVNGLLDFLAVLLLRCSRLGLWINSSGSLLGRPRANVCRLVTILENDGQSVDIAVHFQAFDGQRRQTGQIPTRHARYQYCVGQYRINKDLEEEQLSHLDLRRASVT